MELGKGWRGERVRIAKGQEMLDAGGQMLDHCVDVGLTCLGATINDFLLAIPEFLFWKKRNMGRPQMAESHQKHRNQTSVINLCQHSTSERIRIGVEIVVAC
jgi:hypothetical protein